MENHADVGCVLKVDVHCDACKMKIMEVLSSIIGVYSVTMDAEEGLARIGGEVNPNMLLSALARTGKHAELVRISLKHPQVTKRHLENEHGSYNYGNANIYSYYDALENPNGYGSYGRTLPEYSNANEYYPTTRAVPDRPFNSTNYAFGSLPQAMYVPSYTPREFDPYDDERINCCSIM